MNNKNFAHLLFCLGLIILGCSKDSSVSDQLTSSEQEVALARAVGTFQVSGVGVYALPTECDYITRGADYAVKMTGDIQGCRIH